MGKLSPCFLRIRAIANCSHVVEKGIKPNVGNMFGIKGNRNAPIKTRTRNGKILQAAFYKTANLVHTKRRLYKIGVLFKQFEQWLLKCGKLEEIGLFLHALQRTTAIGAEMLAYCLVLFIGLTDLIFRKIGLFWNTVPAVITALIEVSGFLHLVPKMLDRLKLTLIRGTDKVIIRNP